MNFYLKVLFLFGLFIAGAAAFPHFAEWLRKRDIEGTAKTHILASVRDPATVKWNSKRLTNNGSTTFLTYDVTADKGQGGPVREIWTFEFNAATKDLLNVTQGGVPRLKFNELAPVK